jgi:hypothetical protein
MNLATSRGSRKVEIEVKSLYDEVMTLKTAIEEAIIKGQESMGGLNDIPGSNFVADEDLPFTFVKSGSGVVGWIDDL